MGGASYRVRTRPLFTLVMEEPMESLQLALLECFKLGKALRTGDADAFCEVYDSLLHEDNQDGSEDEDGSENLQFKVRDNIIIAHVLE